MLTGLLFAKYKHTNALINEHSPYLQQHVHNPVNWYPWGEMAFEKAKKEHKLIFLSIGYSTCHWCHEMEKESFTDETVAKLLNDNFISVKVDREAYPQLDKKYQQLYMVFYGRRGGWPLSVFMTPEGKVFYLGTYIPKEEGYGSKGLLNMLPSFAELKEDNAALEKMTAVYTEAEKKTVLSHPLKNKSIKGLMHKVITAMEKEFDSQNGGFASRPKFPEASKIELLMTIYRLNGDKSAYHMAELTLKKMAQSGIYDQVDGGFFRYTTDGMWQSPHFEKMLYTNAELISVYAEMFKETKDPLYRKVVGETINEMQTHFMRNGLYFSASDADSDGEEGGYFIYSYEEVKDALLKKGMQPEAVEAALAYLGIEEDGNVDGELSHLHITEEGEPFRIKEVKAYLKAVRQKRTFPFMDKKIITAWNAMMIKALFTASKIDPGYLEDAQESMKRLWELMRKNKALYHQTLYGGVPKQKGLLEDYAFLCDALLEGYDRTYNAVYLARAEMLGQEAIRKFYRKGRWYLSDDRIEALADFDDRYYTSALSVMMASLMRLAALTETLQYLDVVKKTIAHQGAVLQESPATVPKLVNIYLRLKKGDVIIHAKKRLLLKVQKKIDAIRYPFVLSKVEQSDEYLACTISSCFAYDRNITALIEKIEKAAE